MYCIEQVGVKVAQYDAVYISAQITLRRREPR